MGWKSVIDVSVKLFPGMVTWPGDADVLFERMQDVAEGGSSTLTRLVMGAHSGTHLDAPMHFLAGGDDVESMPLETTLGPCVVLGIADRETVKRSDLEKAGLAPGVRLLLKTRNSTLWADPGFREDFVYLETDAAEYLAALPARCVGVDYLSVGGFHANGREVHEALLGAGVWLIEGLDLSRVEPGEYDLICLPLRLHGVEASPVRVALGERE